MGFLANTSVSGEESAWPVVRHHGAVAGVTGSCHELRLDAGLALLVDCGLFQGREAGDGRAQAERLAIDFDLEGVRALVVTHTHVDHIGRIPWLLAAGFEGPILCSRPTAALLPLMLEDALAVGVTRDRDLQRRVLAGVEQRLVALDYGAWHRVGEDAAGGPGLAVRLQRAGHILGSAYVECRCERPGAQPVTVVFSGDLGGPDTPLLPAPRPPEAADLLVLESTYGDRRHEGRAGRVSRLRAVVERSLADGGAVLVPAFSLGRTQELLYELEQIIHDAGIDGPPADPEAPYTLAPEGGMPDWLRLPVILDSPLAARVTRRYRELQAYWDDEARAVLRDGRRPLAFDQLLTVESHADHERVVAHLRDTGRAAVVIAASGMCTGGRIVDYLEALLGDPRTDVLFVGYQAEGTPGRDIQNWGPKGGWVELNGRRHDIRAAVHTLAGYSAHADQDALLAFATGIDPHPAEIRLVHGEAGAKEILREALAARMPGTRVVIAQ